MRQVRFELLLGSPGDFQVPGDQVEQQTPIRRPLNVRLSAESVDAAARDADVAQEQLDDGTGTNDLSAERVVGPAKGVQHAPRLIPHSSGRIHLVHLQQVFHRRSSDFGYLLRCIARVVFLQELKDASGILKRRVLYRNPLLVPLEGPVSSIVLVGLGIVPGKETVFEIELVHDKVRRVGVVFHVLFEIFVLFDDVVDHAAEEGDVRSGTQGGVHICYGGGSRESRIHGDHRASVLLGLHHPFHADGMVFCGIAAHDQEAITVLEVHPVIGH